MAFEVGVAFPAFLLLLDLSDKTKQSFCLSFARFDNALLLAAINENPRPTKSNARRTNK